MTCCFNASSGKKLPNATPRTIPTITSVLVVEYFLSLLIIYTSGLQFFIISFQSREKFFSAKDL